MKDRSTALGFLVAFATAASAGQVQTWKQEAAKDFQAGKLTRMAVDSDGRVELSRQLKVLAELKADQIWSLVEAPSGELIAGTGNPGLVAKIDRTGKSTILHQADQKQFFAVAVDKGGAIYAASSPDGKIVRLKGAGGPAEEFFDTKQTYIWALAVDEAGAVYAATGPEGKLFKIGPDKKGAVHFQAKQPHLLSLALASDGNTIVGASRDGLVYRVGKDGKGYVIQDAPQADIHAVLVDADGSIYAGTSTPSRSATLAGGKTSGGESSGSMTDLRLNSSGMSTKTKADANAKPEGTAKPDVKPEASATVSGSVNLGGAPSSASAGSASSTAAPGENSVYRIRPDGAVEELLKEKLLVLSLVTQGKRLLVGTGQEGRLIEIDPVTEVHGELARLEQGQICAAVRGKDGAVFLAVGKPAKIYAVEDRYAGTGQFLSTPLDAKMLAKWGKSQWKGDSPEGCTIDVVARTGNVAEPDDTWSSWSPDPTKLPTGRFFQYQATFTSPLGKASPVLREYVLYYATLNQAPKVEKIDLAGVAKPSAGGKSTVKWQASDPNTDPLTYTLELRERGWKEWVTLAKDLTKAEFEWDPTSLPGGFYRLRATASDQLANRESEAMKASKDSDEFILDREPPAVKIAGHKLVGKQLQVQCTGADLRHRLASAAYAIDGKAWTPLFPNDGLFDSSSEEATFTTPALEPGAHVVLIRFEDAVGQIGAADLVVSVPQ